MVSPRCLLLLGSFLLLCQCIDSAPTSSNNSSDAIPASLRSKRTSGQDYDDDSAAALAAIPFADEDKLTDNDNKQKSSTTTTAAPSSKTKRDVDDDEPMMSEGSENNPDFQEPGDAKPNREVDVVFVPVLIREEKIIFIEEVPENTTPAEDDSETGPSVATDYSNGEEKKDSVQSGKDELINADDDFEPIPPKPSAAVDVPPKKEDSEEVTRDKRDTTKTDDSKTDDSTELPAVIDVLSVNIFEILPIANDTDKTDGAEADKATNAHVRKARSPDSRSNNNNNGNTKNSPPRTTPPSSNKQSKPAPRPVFPSGRPVRPQVSPPSPPARSTGQIAPGRGKRSNNGCGGPGGFPGGPVRPNNGLGGGRGGGGGGSASANANANAASIGGKGGSQASASASASASSANNRG